MRNEPPVVSEEALNSMTTAERADALFSGKNRFDFNVSKWKAKNEESYDAAQRHARIGVPQNPTKSAPAAKPEPSAVEIEAMIERFPLPRCQDIFKGETRPNGDTLHREKLADLSPEDQQAARIAAKFFKVIPNDGSGATVKFVYTTHKQRREAREAKEAQAEEARRSWMPPGIERDAEGRLGLVDAQAFADYKKEQEAIAHLEALAPKSQAEQPENPFVAQMRTRKAA